MIKKRKNAKDNKFEIVLPSDAKIEKLAKKLKKFPPLDFRKLIDEARAENGGMSLDDAFEQIVRRKTKKQIADVSAALGLDESDPGRFVKGFVLLSMVFLGVGIVGFSPATHKIARWTPHHDELLFLLMQHFERGGLKESQAIRAIAADPTLEKWFAYKKHSTVESELTVEKRREESLRQRWQSLKLRAPSKIEPNPLTTMSRSLGADAEPSAYQHTLTALDIKAAAKNRKKLS
jgi:hypothetical protein